MIERGQTILLKNGGEDVGVMLVDAKKDIDNMRFAELMFDTLHKEHPGVRHITSAHSYIITGDIEMFDGSEFFGKEALTPQRAREEFSARKWKGGLAYNYPFGNTGTTYRARGWNQSGATSGDFEGDGIPENQEAIALLWIGGSNATPSEAAFDAASELINAIMAADPNVTKVIGHREVKGGTTCPGDVWMQYIAEEKWMTPTPPPPPDYPPPDSYAAPAWAKAEAKGIATDWSDPHEEVTKQDLMVFFDRLGLLD